nr:DNA-directed RNA polymerases I, II, and III subunit RPABC4 isoform X1 [Globicephala melas]
MRAPSSGQSRASRAPRCRGKYAVCPRPSSFGPGAGPAANGRGTTGAQTPALPPLGPWRRIALRARTSWGLVPVVTAAQACSPRTSSRTSSAHTVHRFQDPFVFYMC